MTQNIATKDKLEAQGITGRLASRLMQMAARKSNNTDHEAAANQRINQKKKARAKRRMQKQGRKNNR